MSVPDHLGDLIRRLRQLSENRSLDWEQLNDSAFEVATDTGSIVVSASNARGGFPYELELYDKRDNLVESGRTPRTGPRDLVWSDADLDLAAVWDLARKSAKNVDEVIQGFLDDLK